MRSFPGDKFATAVSMEKKFEYIKASFVVREVAISRKNLPTKNQSTVQMTWHEGKSEGFREILRYDKRNRNAKRALWTSIKCLKPRHIIKDLCQKNLLERVFWYIFLIGCENGFLFTR